MFAGAARIDITPPSSVWMDGMVRAHRSTGVHDALYARCLVLSNTDRRTDALALITVEVCALDAAMCDRIRLRAAACGLACRPFHRSTPPHPEAAG